MPQDMKLKTTNVALVGLWKKDLVEVMSSTRAEFQSGLQSMMDNLPTPEEIVFSLSDTVEVKREERR